MRSEERVREYAPKIVSGSLRTHNIFHLQTIEQDSVWSAPEGEACFRLTRASNASSVLFSDVRVKQ